VADAAWALFSIVDEKKGMKGERERAWTGNNVGGLICSGVSSLQIMPGRLFFIRYLPQCSSLFLFLLYEKMHARHERDSRGARHAWLSWPRAKVSSQVHQRHLPTAPHWRPSAITRGDSDSNCDGHVNHDEDTAASPSGKRVAFFFTP